MKTKKVTGLEEYIKKEKDESNEVAKYSQRQLHKIKDNADTLEILIRSLKVLYLSHPNTLLTLNLVEPTKRNKLRQKSERKGSRIAKMCGNGSTNK